MKRRSFLRNSAFVTIPLILNGNRIAAMAKSMHSNSFYEQSDKILVLVQMDGGNDGLNTVIPLDQYANLQAARPNIILPENSIIKITDELGIHPSMNGLSNLYQEGQLKIIQNVGYPSPNRSHFRSTDILTSASPAKETWTTGWIGRYFDQLYPGFPEGYPNDEQTDPFAITIASRVSETCQGVSANYGMAITNPDNLTELVEGVEDETPDSPYGFELNFLRNAIAQTNAYGEVVTTAAELGANLSTQYDEDNKLAQQLKIVARLISGGLKTSIYVVRMGGYDTHANQVLAGDPLSGKHAELLKELSDAIAAFQDDINLLGFDKRVMGLTFSEFGRQIKSNESLGTDHGEAFPMFLFGSCVDTTILGNNPTIPKVPENREALPYQIDFRNIYGSLLSDWFDLDEASIHELLFPDFNKLDLVDECISTGTDQYLPQELELKLYPNPLSNQAFLEFNSQGEHVKISIFNSLGRRKKVIIDQYMDEGKHRISIRTKEFPSGIYYCRLEMGGKVKTLRMVKK